MAELGTTSIILLFLAMIIGVAVITMSILRSPDMGSTLLSVTFGVVLPLIGLFGNLYLFLDKADKTPGGAMLNEADQMNLFYVFVFAVLSIINMRLLHRND